jgi:ParB/RepB/Spo0J family partition protein
MPRKYMELLISEIAEPVMAARVSMDEGKLTELADSIRRQGVIQPIVVVPRDLADRDAGQVPQGQGDSPDSSPASHYEIVAGHRRYLASIQAGLERIPAMVWDDKGEALEAAKLHENIFREDLTAAEEGIFYHELVEKYHYNEAELCRAVQHTTDYIYARMDLVKKDAYLTQLVAERKITFSVAREFLKCSDAEHRRYLGNLAADSGASYRTAQSWVLQWKAQQAARSAVETAANAPAIVPAVAENPLKCVCCGRGDDPYNLRLLYIHWYEFEAVKRILTEAGLEVKGTCAA